MADERPPIWAQLITGYLATGPSGELLMWNR
ncbi:hypothetical protein N692_15000 [Lactiplantibacillus plantarum EGD-AQ4]|nr:hypothetical protein N692_15000 [Lactiplantibacillus plantarum EGD-AQ4]